MNIDKTLEKCRAELARQKEIEAKATPGLWYTVDQPWRARHYDKEFGRHMDDPTYIVAGHPDPHLGKPVLEPPMIDEYPADDNGDGYDKMVREGYSNLDVVCLSRNLNPARLQVVESFLDSVEGWVDSLHAADEEVDTDDTESWGWQLTSAAALLGVEVQS